MMQRTLLLLALASQISFGIAQPKSKDVSRARKLIERTLQGMTPSQETSFNLSAVMRSFGHLSKPWETSNTQNAGGFSVAPALASYFQADSIMMGGRYYTASKVYNDTTLVTIAYGRTKPSPSSMKRHADQSFELLTLYPAFFLKSVLSENGSFTITAFTKSQISIVEAKDKENRIFRLFIDAEKNELTKIVVDYPHEMYGDATRTFLFNGYASIPGGGKFPSAVVENEYNVEKNRTTISVSSKAFNKVSILNMIPADYKLKADEPVKSPEVVYTQYNENIHLLELKHTDDRVLLVEFKDFLVAAEAPVNTENGELIIRKAREIAPGKPIRYFLFGHHHPHYIGGIRAFIHEGSTVLALPQNESYIRQLASFPHTLKPDVLHREKKELKIETFEKEKVISDGDFEMRVYHIGKMSDHTEDYLIYYFPKYKLLFEDDLVWISREGDLKPAGSRQKGLYNGILLYGLDVDQIIQSWPVQDYGVKTIIPFKELEQSVKLVPVN